MARKKIKDWIPSEKDLAKLFIIYLEENGYDVYQEVPTCNGYCDIIGIKNGLIFAFETKMQFSFDVMEQAENNKNISNYTYLVVPYPKRGGLHYKKKLSKMIGIGVITVDEYRGVNIELESDYTQNIKRKIKLKDWQKLNEAGGKERWTPFKILVRDVKEYIKDKDGVSFKELWDNLEVYYSSLSSFRTSFTRNIYDGVINGIEIKNKMLYDKKI
jgi:hypothetical protein